jgi:hypothetical protein
MKPVIQTVLAVILLSLFIIATVGLVWPNKATKK